MNNSLHDLSLEYYHAAEMQSELIRKYTLRKREAHRKGQMEEEYRLRRKLYDLYAQRNDLLDIAHHLNTYYTKGAPCIN